MGKQLLFMFDITMVCRDSTTKCACLTVGILAVWPSGLAQIRVHISGFVIWISRVQPLLPATSWICSQFTQVQILGHALYIANSSAYC